MCFPESYATKTADHNHGKAYDRSSDGDLYHWGWEAYQNLPFKCGTSFLNMSLRADRILTGFQFIGHVRLQTDMLS